MINISKILRPWNKPIDVLVDFPETDGLGYSSAVANVPGATYDSVVVAQAVPTAPLPNGYIPVILVTPLPYPGQVVVAGLNTNTPGTPITPGIIRIRFIVL